MHLGSALKNTGLWLKANLSLSAPAIMVLLALAFLLAGLPRLVERGAEQEMRPAPAAQLAGTEIQLPAGAAVSAVKPNPAVQLYKVKRGDTWSSLLGARGHSADDIKLLVDAIKQTGTRNLMLNKDEVLEVLLDQEQRPVKLVKSFDNGSILELELNKSSGLKAQLLDSGIIETERKVVGTIKTSFAAAANSLNIPYAVINEFVDLFSSRVEFSRDLRSGDTFSIKYTERKSGRTGTALSPGPIQSAAMRSGNELLVAMRYTAPGGRAHYFDANGKAITNSFLRYPLQFTRISSSFSWARFHPLLQRTRPHLGVDFAAPYGTPVRAVADGRVIEAAYDAEGGRQVKIRHSGRFISAYLHLSRFALGLKGGGTVSKGQVIGYVGSSGVSTGPHLHYALFDYGKYVDPLRTKLPSLVEAKDSIPDDVRLAVLEEIRLQYNQYAGTVSGESAG
jgi:murein DD-endopeptidase MepM/ murein hydrolase activator NlpD